jgi:hypothetical protein
MKRDATGRRKSGKGVIRAQASTAAGGRRWCNMLLVVAAAEGEEGEAKNTGKNSTTNTQFQQHKLRHP